jgi:hypothetical protein
MCASMPVEMGRGTRLVQLLPAKFFLSAVRPTCCEGVACACSSGIGKGCRPLSVRDTVRSALDERVRMIYTPASAKTSSVIKGSRGRAALDERDDSEIAREARAWVLQVEIARFRQPFQPQPVLHFFCACSRGKVLFCSYDQRSSNAGRRATTHIFLVSVFLIIDLRRSYTYTKRAIGRATHRHSSNCA